MDAEPTHRRGVQQLADEVLRLGRGEAWVALVLAGSGATEGLHLVLAIKGRLAVEHLVGEYAEGPPR